MDSQPGICSPVSSISILLGWVTKNKFAALVVGKWLYIDGGEIWGKWHGEDTTPSAVWSTPFP
jgi:hypothetical protein